MALTEVQESLTRKMRLLDGYRFDNDARRAKENVALPGSVPSDLTLNDERKLDEVGSADQAALGVMNQRRIMGSFGLPKENRSERGCIEDHFGRPRSSYKYSAWSR